MPTTAREQRGMAIAATMSIKHQGSLWLVPSPSGDKPYTVDVTGDAPRCTGPDFGRTGLPRSSNGPRAPNPWQGASRTRSDARTTRPRMSRSSTNERSRHAIWRKNPKTRFLGQTTVMIRT